jgi:hypothetical protein
LIDEEDEDEWFGEGSGEGSCEEGEEKKRSR